MWWHKKWYLGHSKPIFLIKHIWWRRQKSPPSNYCDSVHRPMQQLVRYYIPGNVWTATKKVRFQLQTAYPWNAKQNVHYIFEFMLVHNIGEVVDINSIGLGLSILLVWICLPFLFSWNSSTCFLSKRRNIYKKHGNHCFAKKLSLFNAIIKTVLHSTHFPFKLLAYRS